MHSPNNVTSGETSILKNMSSKIIWMDQQKRRRMDMSSLLVCIYPCTCIDMLYMPIQSRDNV